MNKLRVSDKLWPKDLLNCTKGGAAIEFAIAIPVFFLLLLGIIEFSLISFCMASLEGSTIRAAREGTTNYNPTGGSRYEYILSIIKNGTSGLMNPNKIELDAVAYSDFTDVSNPSFCNSAKSCKEAVGGSENVVQYTATYPWPIMAPLLGKLIGKNGIFTIQSSALVRNETLYNGPPPQPALAKIPAPYLLCSNCGGGPYSGPPPSAE